MASAIEKNRWKAQVRHADSDNDGVIDLRRCATIRPWDPNDTVDHYFEVPADLGWIALDVELNLRLQQADCI